ncbi:dienelactone hydrolase family protein [Rhodococcus qingshengii]|jgi:carboxymethylenebutenolidase|uniref:dienelactone hydrolase family protein n=1 Tax=Rhodococcus qingshengii TaxID=334542 RepID=UPI0024B89A95|nr:dienelactone hydrolase family protein [Rhodococcus qingshengii]MDJ0490698.1 dienelactone hydrolase family protein [Rhodococcus qingshengii]
MNDVLIRPTQSVLRLHGRNFPTLEISLGGTPKGIVLLACDGGDLLGGTTEVMNRLAEHGYESLAAEIPLEDASARLSVLFARAEERGWTAEQTGMLGWGSGGRIVLDAITEKAFGAAVSLSPALRSDDSGNSVAQEEFSGRVATPWLGMFGADDPAAPESSVANLRAVLGGGSDVHAVAVIYPGVGDGFYRHGNDGVGYAAWYDSWQRTIEWLEARIAPRLTPLAQQWRQRCIRGSGSS